MGGARNRCADHPVQLDCPAPALPTGHERRSAVLLTGRGPAQVADCDRFVGPRGTRSITSGAAAVCAVRVSAHWLSGYAHAESLDAQPHGGVTGARNRSSLLRPNGSYRSTWCRPGSR